MAKKILYEELVKDFRITDEGRLFRLLKGGSWKEVEIKDNTGDGKTGGYCNVGWQDKTYRSHRLMYCLYHKVDVDTDLFIDHHDGNKLNNSKENLILGTKRDNNQNKQHHRNGRLVGTCFDKARDKWRSQIRINKNRITLGYFTTEIEAHECYMKACELLEQYIDNKQFRKLLK